ncbi:DUF4376 domain-containing protein [Neptunomonas phycophila]|uniref:DUF4376 domain-containing protein n=1 Tax=Neptunomonas phycophila TaxID=1572645 RepID=UPI003736C5DE
MSNLIISNNNNRKAWRDNKIASGFTWNGNTFQADKDSRGLINGRVTKLNTLIINGRITPEDDEYIDNNGNTRPLVWWTTTNVVISFTVQEYLNFSIALEEWIEDIYTTAKAN